MIAEFLSAQKDLLAQAEERLEQYQDKMDRQDLKGLVNSYHARLFAGIRVWERSWTPTLPPFLISRSCRQPLASHPCQALETCSQWSDRHKSDVVFAFASLAPLPSASGLFTFNLWIYTLIDSWSVDGKHRPRTSGKWLPHLKVTFNVKYNLPFKA